MKVGPVLFSRALTERIVIARQTGSWVAGGKWAPGAPILLTIRAVVTTPSSTDLQMLPEGDQDQGAITVYVPAPATLDITQATGTSDRIRWHGVEWRVMRVWDLRQWGYEKAIAVRVGGEREP